MNVPPPVLQLVYIGGVLGVAAVKFVIELFEKSNMEDKHGTLVMWFIILSAFLCMISLPISSNWEIKHSLVKTSLIIQIACYMFILFSVFNIHFNSPSNIAKVNKTVDGNRKKIKK